MKKINMPPSDTESESEQSDIGSMEDDENRLSDDEDFPISSGEEDEDEADEEDDSESEEDQPAKIGAWAGAMAKVLKSEKTEILSKAKKVEDVAKKKEKKQYDFQIDGEIKEELDDKKPSQKVLERLLEKKKFRERREVSDNCLMSEAEINSNFPIRF